MKLFRRSLLGIQQLLQAVKADITRFWKNFLKNFFFGNKSGDHGVSWDKSNGSTTLQKEKNHGRKKRKRRPGMPEKQ